MQFHILVFISLGVCEVDGLAPATSPQNGSCLLQRQPLSVQKIAAEFSELGTDLPAGVGEEKAEELADAGLELSKVEKQEESAQEPADLEQESARVDKLKESADDSADTEQEVGKVDELEESAQFANKLGSCNPFYFEAICDKDREGYRQKLLALIGARDSSMQAWFTGGAGDDLAQRVRTAYLQRLSHLSEGSHWDFRQDGIPGSAWDSFEALLHLDARELLAFQETWTDEDTEVLRALENSPDEFTEGNLTTAKFKADLPSISMLRNLTSRQSVAIVGAGPSVKGHGQEIDRHDVVVRFNNHIGPVQLEGNDTGMKMDVHVVNWLVNIKKEPGEDQQDPLAGVLNIDLESTHPGFSYCKRWRRRGFGKQVVWGFRPTAFCGLPYMWGWTRGFLFYWLIGRLFEQVDVYGMGVEDLWNHYSKKGRWAGENVGEPFLAVEHIIYGEARRLQKDQEAYLAKLRRAAKQKKIRGDDEQPAHGIQLGEEQAGADPKLINKALAALKNLGSMEALMN